MAVSHKGATRQMFAYIPSQLRPNVIYHHKRVSRPYEESEINNALRTSKLLISNLSAMVVMNAAIEHVHALR